MKTVLAFAAMLSLGAAVPTLSDYAVALSSRSHVMLSESSGPSPGGSDAALAEANGPTSGGRDSAQFAESSGPSPGSRDTAMA